MAVTWLVCVDHYNISGCGKCTEMNSQDHGSVFVNLCNKKFVLVQTEFCRRPDVYNPHTLHTSVVDDLHYRTHSADAQLHLHTKHNHVTILIYINDCSAVGRF